MSEEKYDSKTLRLNIKVAQDTLKKSPIVTYFLTSYTINKAYEYLDALQSKGQDDSELANEVQSWFQILDEVKQIVGQGALQSQEECRKVYYEYAYSLFLRADNKYRDDDWSPQLAQEFFYAN